MLRQAHLTNSGRAVKPIELVGRGRDQAIIQSFGAALLSLVTDDGGHRAKRR